ncbi:MAG: hypothetical protein JXQ87_06425 [Bacteroidia bacterium]
MSKSIYEKIGSELEISHKVNTGQMFGKPCIKANGKAFAAFFKDEMVFKIGREEAYLIINKYPGAQLWDPSGKKRPMKDWLQVPNAFSSDWNKLALQALNFINT